MQSTNLLKVVEGNNTISKVVECLSNIGIAVETSITNNDKLSDFIIDSLSFITFIIELEQIFEIEIDNNYLLLEEWKTFGDAKEIIEQSIIQQR